ncbi:MAG: hypothetical protein AAGC95_09995 [Pseudomonadota bacterium]
MRVLVLALCFSLPVAALQAQELSEAETGEAPPPELSPEDQALADWAEYRSTMQGDGAAFETPPPAYLSPLEQRDLYEQLNRLAAVQRLAVELLAQDVYETALSPWQRTTMQNEAHAFYKTLAPGDRIVMAQRRRAEFRALSQGERARWRRAEGPTFLGLIEPQRDIFRVLGFERLAAMSDAEQSERFAAADVIMKARAAEQRLADAGALAPTSAAESLKEAVMSPEERMRFQAMTPDQQRQYLLQVQGQTAAPDSAPALP